MSRPGATQRGYGAKWKAARVAFLRANPRCRLCAERGLRVRADTVDHIEPHRGDRKLFWRRSNWQALCSTCHNGAKQSQEKSGALRGHGADGVPLDSGHHWHGGGEGQGNNDRLRGPASPPRSAKP